MNEVLTLPERLWEDYFSTVDDFWSELMSGGAYACNPNVDIMEGKDNYILRVELPGLEEKEFNVEHENGILSISGKWREPEDKDLTTLRRELPEGEFCRRFSIPEDVDSERIEAHYKNGLLELILPKKETEKPKAVKIEVH